MNTKPEDVLNLPPEQRISCCLGTTKYDAHPEAKLATPDRFLEFLLQVQNRSKNKGGRYVCGPLKHDDEARGARRPHRCAANALPCNWLAFDIDGVDRPETFNRCMQEFGRYKGVAYHTSSSTPAAPRGRVILLASKPMSRDERQFVSRAVATEVGAFTSVEGSEIKFDDSVYRTEQPVYLPTVSAKGWALYGTPVDVDTFLAAYQAAAPDTEAPLPWAGYTELTPHLTVRIRSALAALPPSYADDREFWVKMMLALRPLGDGAFELWDEWASQSSLHDPEDSAKKWDSAKPEGRITVASLFFEAQQNGWRNTTEREQGEPDLPVDIFKATPVPTFPGDVLPEAARAYVKDQADRSGIDAGMLSMFSLSVIAAAISEEIKLQPKANDPSWQESARLWIAAVGDPSIKKTPAFKAVAGPLYKQHAAWAEENRLARRKHDMATKAFKKLQSEAEKAVAAGNTVDLPEEPALPEINRAMVNDITVEALGQVLQCTARGTLVQVDELSGWFGSMDAYKGGKGDADRGHYLNLYNGGSHLIDRIGRGHIAIRNWGASLVGGIQPEKIRKIANTMVDDGLLQRFNIFFAANAGADHDRPRNQSMCDEYESLVTNLFRMTAAGPVRFSDGARQVWDRFRSDLRKIIDNQTFPLKYRTALGKWEGQFVRYALVLHCAGLVPGSLDDLLYGTDISICVPADSQTVSTETAERVERLFRDYLLPNLWRFHNDLLTESPAFARARWLAGYILSNELTSIDRRRIKRCYRDLRSASDWEVHNAMEVLNLFGWSGPVEGQVPPFAKWEILPTVHEIFKDHAVRERRDREAQRQFLETIFKSAG